MPSNLEVEVSNPPFCLLPAWLQVGQISPQIAADVAQMECSAASCPFKFESVCNAASLREQQKSFYLSGSSFFVGEDTGLKSKI